MAERAVAEGTAVDPAPHPVGPEAGRRPWRNDIAAAAVCVAFGVLMSVLPYGLWWLRIGEPVWLADYDEMFYLQFAAQAYFHHPTRLSDPVVAAPDSKSAYSMVTLGPGVVASSLLGAGPMRASFFWRLGGGIGVGLMTFLLFRHFFGRPLVAMVLTCLLMSDVGMSGCHLLFKQWVVAAKVWTGHAGPLLAQYPVIHPMWRIINPSPSLPYLILHVLLLARARDRPTALRLGLSALGFGLLFYTYFYYYTAACLALALAFALDAGHRKVYFHTAWAGGLLGLPGVVSTALFQRSVSGDWLQRSDKFVPVPHFSQLMIPLVACALLAVGLTWVALRRRDLLYVGVLALSGVLLANHAVVTGLQIENFHWYYVWTSMIAYLTVILAAGALAGPVSGSRKVAGVLLGLWAVHLGVGVWLRAVEVTRTRESVELMADYVTYRAERRAEAAAPLTPNSVIAGDRRFVKFATIVDDQRPLSGYAALLSPYVDNASWNERLALENYLLGLGASEFEAQERFSLETGIWGPEAHDPSRRAETLAKRLAAFRAVENDCRPALRKYGVRYVALPSGRGLPAAMRPDWVTVGAGTTWDVFTPRTPAPGSNP